MTIVFTPLREEDVVLVDGRSRRRASAMSDGVEEDVLPHRLMRLDRPA